MQAYVTLHRPLIQPQRVFMCAISSASSKHALISVSKRENFALSEKETWWDEGIVRLMQHKGLLSSRQNEISSSCESEVTVIFPLYGASEHWCSRPHTMALVAAHISSIPPVTVACPVESHRAPKWNFCIYNHFPHFSQMHHTSLPESPRQSRYSYKTSFSYPSCCGHFTRTRSTRIGLKLVMNHWLSLQNLEPLDVSQP